MTDTVLSSATREVVIGFGRPFVMIGERINPTGRKLLAEEMKNGDFSRVEADAIAQVEAGAHMLDVNAGIPLADEPALLAKAVQLVQSITDVPLSIDSSIIEALEAGLAVYQGKPLVNSVTGEEEVLERVLPLIAKYGAAVVAISNDETGISMDPDVRFEVAKRIVERAADFGIPPSDVVVDPLVMPIGALGQAGQHAFHLIRRLRERAQGQHDLRRVERQLRPAEPSHRSRGTFLAMAIGAGMTSAIMNPIHAETKAAVLAADVLMGTDENCATWIRANRDPNAPVGRRRSPTRAVAGDGSDAIAVAEHRIVFTPSGLSGRSTHGTTVLDAARRLGADLDTVCGGRGICGRCQVEPSVGSFAKWAITVAPTCSDRRRRSRPTTHGKPAVCSPGVASAARRSIAATSSSPSRREPGAQTGRPQGRRPAPITVDPQLHAAERRRRRSRRARRFRDRSPSSASRRPSRRDARLPSSTNGRSRRSPSRVLPYPAQRGQGRRRSTVAVDESNVVVGIWPGYRRHGARRCRRRRLDDDRRAPLRPDDGRGAGQRRSHEPADPLRRGSHEPGLVRDDEPGRRPRADRVQCVRRSTS